MKSLDKRLRVLLVASVLGCGQQLVDFPNASTPEIVSTTPLAGAGNVDVGRTLSATFSEAMDPATINEATFTLRMEAGAVAGTVGYSGRIATFQPAQDLEPGTIYTATFSTSAKSAANETPIAATYSWSFTTAGERSGAGTDGGSDAGVDGGSDAGVDGGSGAGVDGGSDAGPILAPLVLLVEPQNSAIGVPTRQVLSAAFSEPIDCNSVTASTFQLKQGAASVTGAIGCAGPAALSVTFTPANPLASHTLYTATISGGSSGVKNLLGDALASDYVWSFTTVDTTPPRITQVNPADGASGVCPNVQVSATFNEPMNANTLGALSFTLSAGNAPVTGAVAYDAASQTASFTPAQPLSISTLYTATVTTGAQDENGNALASDKVWSFTTGSTLCQNAVNLGSLSSFVAVAGAGLTNTNSGGVTVLDGNVGLSPTGTCLGDGSPCSALDPVIRGTLYADDPGGVAAQAKADLTDAYNDAAGRPAGTLVDDLSGLTLPPGVYTSGSTMSIAVGGTLVLDAQGDANAVWIFQVGSSLTVNNSAQVLLLNGANADNVYWAIFASSTIGANTIFAGNVLAGASNSVLSGAVIQGRLLCRTGQISLIADTVTMPTGLPVP